MALEELPNNNPLNIIRREHFLRIRERGTKEIRTIRNVEYAEVGEFAEQVEDADVCYFIRIDLDDFENFAHFSDVDEELIKCPLPNSYLLYPFPHAIKQQFQLAAP